MSQFQPPFLVGSSFVGSATFQDAAAHVPVAILAQPLGSPPVLLESTMTLSKGSPFYELLITFVAATAGLTPVFDSVRYGDFLEGIAGHYQGKVWKSMTTD